MNRKDAEVIVSFVVSMCRAFGPDAQSNPGIVVDRFLKYAEGVPGSGVCICKISPESRAKQTQGWPPEDIKKWAAKLWLDHRCPHHGEKAQPAVWGRHKDLEMSVTIEQWESLRIRHE